MTVTSVAVVLVTTVTGVLRVKRARPSRQIPFLIKLKIIEMTAPTTAMMMKGMATPRPIETPDEVDAAYISIQTSMCIYTHAVCISGIHMKLGVIEIFAT